MRLIFVSSVLHYLFGTCIREEHPKSRIIYFKHKKDLTSVFRDIDFELGFSGVDIVDYDDLDVDKLKKETWNEIIFSNRHDNRQVKLFERIKSKSTTISFLEEGASIYLKNPYFEYSSAFNLVKYFFKIKNYSMPRYIFDKAYTLSLFDIPRIKRTCAIVDLYPLLEKHVRHYSKYDGSVVLLSQWLVEQNYLDADQLIEYYSQVFKQEQLVFYKAHPWDDDSFTKEVIKKCGFQLIDTTLPIELLFLKSRNMRVFGFWTTTLFYLDRLTQNKVYSLLKDISKLSPALSKLYQNTSFLIKKSSVIEYKQ